MRSLNSDDLDKVKSEDEIKYETDERQTVIESDVIGDAGPEAGQCRQTDAVSDSEIIRHKQNKHCILDDTESIGENVSIGDVLSEPAPVSPPSHQASDRPTLDAGSFLQAVQSFPLPPDQLKRPVVGPPSLDQETLRRMEQLQIPMSLPKEDVDRIARLEHLRQLSCTE